MMGTILPDTTKNCSLSSNAYNITNQTKRSTVNA